MCSDINRRGTELGQRARSDFFDSEWFESSEYFTGLHLLQTATARTVTEHPL